MSDPATSRGYLHSRSESRDPNQAKDALRDQPSSRSLSGILRLEASYGITIHFCPVPHFSIGTPTMLPYSVQLPS